VAAKGNPETVAASRALEPWVFGTCGDANLAAVVFTCDPLRFCAPKVPKSFKGYQCSFRSSSQSGNSDSASEAIVDGGPEYYCCMRMVAVS
jgi:hypothetical protein